jgi:hypothetical protein
MRILASHWLKLWAAAQLMRRGMAVFCAIAIVLVAFAHSAQHFNGQALFAVAQVDLGSVDDGLDAPDKASVTFEQCQGCSIFAMVAFSPSTRPDLVASDLMPLKFEQHRPHTPVAETPPPISSI